MSDHDTNTTHSSDSPEDANEGNNLKGTLKALIIALGGVGLLMSIFVLLPMLFTLLSNGDYRP
ncbi:MAG: hypothetical protein LAC70_07790 [Methylovulum sp.]|jgi:hypothetical protein|nr:hypothetical protein [Methylovulum sp.]TSA42078.1 MAG: hypothetical protein D4R63_01355 [Methylococcaceae bacterium]